MPMPLKIVVFLALSATLCACERAPQAAKPADNQAAPKAAASPAPPPPLVKYLSPETHFDSPAFSQVAVVANRGKTYYISGQIPVDAGYELLAKDDLRAQTKAVLNNLDMALKAAGISKNDVVKINIGIVSKEARDSFIVSEELMAYFGRLEMPASTMTGMPFIVADGILIQIDAIAATE